MKVSTAPANTVFTFFGARGDVSDNRMTNYTVGATTVSLQTANNKTNTVSINNISPDANNEIVVNLKEQYRFAAVFITSMRW